MAGRAQFIAFPAASVFYRLVFIIFPSCALYRCDQIDLFFFVYFTWIIFNNPGVNIGSSQHETRIQVFNNR